MDARQLFSRLDDHRRLAAHMARSFSMMAGGAMHFTIDDWRGMEVGSRIVMSGRVAGLALLVEEVVTERNPPYLKVWETRGHPRLLVIGDYRLDFWYRRVWQKC